MFAQLICGNIIVYFEEFAANLGGLEKEPVVLMRNSKSSAEQKGTAVSIERNGKLLHFAQYHNPASFRQYCHLAGALQGQGKYEEAKSAWYKAVELDPENINIRIDFGISLAETDDIEGALEQFEAAVKLDQTNLDANYLLGMAHFHLEHFDLALKYWKRCLADKTGQLEDETGLRICLAEAYRALGRPHKAIFQLNNILERNPADIDAHNLLGMILLEIGENAFAIDILKRAVTCNPDFYRSHLNLGVVYFNCGAIDFSIHEFKKACQCNPKDADSFYNLGRALTIKGELQQACQALEKSLELSPSQLDCLDFLGNLELLRGDFQAAQGHFSKLLADDPNNIEALCSIAEAEHRQYNYQEAEEYLQQAYKLAPENPLVHYSLALLYRDQSKKLDKAAKHMRKAVDLQQNNPEYQLLYGDILAQTDKESKAKEAWEKAIELDPSLADDVRSRLKKIDKT